MIILIGAMSVDGAAAMRNCGHQNAITYKEIFPLVQNGDMWLGHGFKGGAAHFIAPHYEDYAAAGDHREGMIRVSGVAWFTNLDHAKRHDELTLYRTYNPDDYPRYDNHDAINVDRVADIPCDCNGVMGVPITFLDKHNPEQFEILGIANSARWIGYECFTLIEGRKIYNRILIRRVT